MQSLSGALYYQRLAQRAGHARVQENFHDGVSAGGSIRSWATILRAYRRQA